jgi:spermidine/putrescine-binding protein
MVKHSGSPSTRQPARRAQQALTRRAVLGASLGTLAAASLPARVGAQTPPTISVIMVNSALNATLKAWVQEDAKCIINDSPFTSSSDTVSRLAAPGGSSRYDLMASSVEFSRVPLMGAKAGEERVQPIDLSLIPNFAQLADAAQGAIGQRDGKTYLVPIFFGFDTVLFNRDKVPEDDAYTNSWGAIFEDKYAGRIGWYDVAHQMMMAAGLYLGHAAPETMDAKDLEAVVKFLIAKKKNVRAMWTDYAVGTNLMATGEIVCTYGTVPMRVELQTKGFNVAGARPKEGVLSVTNVAYIPKDAKNPKPAHAAINALLSARYAAELPKASGYLSTSKLGAAAFTEAQRKALGYGILDGSIKHRGLLFPAQFNAWLEGWNRVKSA